MEYQLWKAAVALAAGLVGRRSPRLRFGDLEVVAVYYWAVVHDRPVSWACRPCNWPPHLSGRPRPSPATMSRRLRTAAVVAVLDELQRRACAPRDGLVFWSVDAKPLPIGGCTKDRQAGYGKAAGAMAKGYKLHAIAAADGSLAAWRVAAMNVDERAMARRMLRDAAVAGYVAGDANYDSNRLHAVCDARGEVQLVTPRRYGPGRGTGRRRQEPGRLRSIELTEGPSRAFARGLLDGRVAIERCFGNLTNWWGGLSGLPAWVRTHRRVRRWVQAKLALNALKRRRPATTYDAS